MGCRVVGKSSGRRQDRLKIETDLKNRCARVDGFQVGKTQWWAGNTLTIRATMIFTRRTLSMDYFYRCTVHFEDSSIITHQQMHQYYLLFKFGFIAAGRPSSQYTRGLQIILPVILARKTSAP
jgi:hypothetical protein